ncbi:MAG: PEP-CTERM sorting domain-containing protein [Verrucomicrobiales bacterium]|jgi:hypothetical protein|nr:PEP-CTERM sorting domain-containing protein [Verrucomicrobiales bacterium]
MKTNNNRKIGALVASTLALVLSVAQADEFRWNKTGEGTWDSTIPNWYNLTEGDIAGALPGGNDDVTISGDSTIVHLRTNPGTLKSLTISSGVTLEDNYQANRINLTDFTNAGLITFNAGRLIAVSNSTTISGTMVVESNTTLLQLATANNTGGLISVRNGGVEFRWSNITGGRVEIYAGASYVHTDVQDTTSFSGVTFDNAGYFDWNSRTGGGGRTKAVTFSDGTFTNSGTINLQQLGDTGGGTNIGRTLSIQLSGANVFTNSGKIFVLNETPDNDSGNQNAQFTVDANATLVNNSGASIVINNSANGTTNGAASAQYSRLTVSDGATFTNSGSIAISLAAATTDDAQHYATLLIGADWTNTGIITVDRANKTNAVAALDLTGQAYTQTGADAVTRLLNGGQLNAASVTISEGLLGGNGAIISATTTISAGATLDPDGTLTLTSLTLDNGSILNFSLADLDLLNITGNLTLSDATLNLTDSEVSTGIYSIASYGTLTDGYALTVSGLSDEYTYALDFITDSKILLTIIPEPATWALLLTGALTLAALRRRR